MPSSEIITPNFPITLLRALWMEKSKAEKQGHTASFEGKTLPSQKANKKTKI